MPVVWCLRAELFSGTAQTLRGHQHRLGKQHTAPCHRPVGGGLRGTRGCLRVIKMSAALLSVISCAVLGSAQRTSQCNLSAGSRRPSFNRHDSPESRDIVYISFVYIWTGVWRLLRIWLND